MVGTSHQLRFEKSAYWFAGLLVLAVAGFWNSYFSKFFSGENDSSFYFHFHAGMMMLWICLLIIQPLLFRNRKMKLHRMIGKLSYILMPVMLLSVLLVLNSGLKGVPAGELTFNSVIFPVRDFFLLASAFGIGVWYRRDMPIHARAMIITGILFIEPALFRFLGRVVFKGMAPLGGWVGMFLILSLLATLIFLERKQKRGKWLFPAFLIIDILVYCIVIFQIPLSFLDGVIVWFAGLPLI